MKIKNLIILFVGFITILYSCSEKNTTITPVEFPETLSIEGFNFPEDSNKI